MSGGKEGFSSDGLSSGPRGAPTGLAWPFLPWDARARVEQGKERQGREGEEKGPSASMETTLPEKPPGWQPKGCGADITKTSTA